MFDSNSQENEKWTKSAVCSCGQTNRISLVSRHGQWIKSSADLLYWAVYVVYTATDTKKDSASITLHTVAFNELKSVW